MKKLSIAVGMLCLFGISTTALAQSLFQRCENRKAEIQTMNDQIKQIDNEIANVNDQIRDLMQQMADLRRKRTSKQGHKTALQRKIRAEEASFKRMCSSLSQCDAYERTIDRLKARLAPMGERLRKIREEIRARGADLTRHNQAVDRIENSYAQLGCDNLVPGQTADSTIDRCTNLFKEWNDLLTDINTLKRSVAALQGRYQRVARKMRAFSVDLARLTKQMREACSHSTRIADLDALEKEQDDYRKMKDDLNDISSRVRKFRRLKIVKPVIRPKKKPKPVITPKKEKKSKPVIKPKEKAKPVIRPR
jgi:chromosome segregation ATPase